MQLLHTWRIIPEPLLYHWNKEATTHHTVRESGTTTVIHHDQVSNWPNKQPEFIYPWLNAF